MAKRSADRSGHPPRKLAASAGDRILDAAGKVFAERGFRGASIDEIAGLPAPGSRRSPPSSPAKRPF
jgi:AcrR family transcriptional regulator